MLPRRWLRHYLLPKHYGLEDVDQRFHFFNSYFWQKFHKEKSFDAGFKRVAKWTKDVDVFDRDFLFIPINVR